MNPRWINSFSVLAVLLLIVAVCGVVLQGRMVFDPGRPLTGWEWLLYLLAAGLMVINAALSANAPEIADDGEDERKRQLNKMANS